MTTLLLLGAQLMVGPGAEARLRPRVLTPTVTTRTNTVISLAVGARVEATQLTVEGHALVTRGATTRVDGSRGADNNADAVCVTLFSAPPAILRHWDVTEDVTAADGTTTTKIIRTMDQVNVECGGRFYQAVRCVAGDCPTGTPPPIPPSAESVALSLIAHAPFEIPQPVLSPALDRADKSLIAGMPFFYAIPAAQWHDIPLSGTACVETACTSASIVARPTVLYFEPGDQPGDLRTCHRYGTVVRTGAQATAAGDDCAYRFQRRGTFEGAIGIHYEISWTASDGSSSGNVTQDSEQRVTIPVTEVQAVITG